MEIELRKSGLVIPKEHPQKPKSTYPIRSPTEIKNEEKREIAKEGLDKLWEAMELSNGSILRDNYHLYYSLYEYVGTLLLGKDTPEHEILC